MQVEESRTQYDPNGLMARITGYSPRPTETVDLPVNCEGSSFERRHSQYSPVVGGKAFLCIYKHIPES